MNTMCFTHCICFCHEVKCRGGTSSVESVEISHRSSEVFSVWNGKQWRKCRNPVTSHYLCNCDHWHPVYTISSNQTEYIQSKYWSVTLKWFFAIKTVQLIVFEFVMELEDSMQIIPKRTVSHYTDCAICYVNLCSIFKYIHWNLYSSFSSGVWKRNDGSGKTIDAGAIVEIGFAQGP
jgi:hypothetical protein